MFSTLHEHELFFTLRNSCTGKRGLSPEQKATAPLRLLAYSCTADSVHEYVRIGESTALVEPQSIQDGFWSASERKMCGVRTRRI